LEFNESNNSETSKTPIPKAVELPDLAESCWNINSPATMAAAAT
jgi:hypothetical protein